MTQVLKVMYSIDNSKMTDEEFENQLEREILITPSMLSEIIEKYDLTLEKGDTIEISYFGAKNNLN